MNAQRRKALAALVSKLEELQDEIDSLQAEEQESFDNLPEGLQQSERGQASEQAADDLQEVYDEIDSAVTKLIDLANV